VKYQNAIGNIYGQVVTALADFTTHGSTRLTNTFQHNNHENNVTELISGNATLYLDAGINDFAIH
jgi:hypothetical protein